MGLEIYPLPLVESEDYSDLYLLMSRPPTKFRDVTYSFLIKGASRPIVVDTGIQKGKFAEFGWMESTKPDWDLVKQLERLGVKTEGVEYVIHTHLHMDHCGQDYLFPDARIVIQRKELEAAAVPRIPMSMKPKESTWPMLFYDRNIISKFVGEFWDRLILLDGEQEITAGLKCVPLGGHTPGSQAIYVETDKGTAIITGDVSYLYDNIEKDIPIGFYYNLEDEIKALAKIRKEGKFILPGHDPKILKRFPHKVPP
jgi:glyoxylase-like metal-dependent hydrolase (beta-lactamase superfamily II)